MVKNSLGCYGNEEDSSKKTKSCQAGEHFKEPSRAEKLLGGLICEDLKWKEHLLGSDQSLVRQLSSRINGLVKVSLRAPLKTRLTVANRIFMSKL